jgi:hypothetical protein
MNYIQEFFKSLSFQSVEILMNKYQSNLESGVTDKESFEKEVRSMSTYEKYVRRKRYKKLPAVFSV